MNNRKAEARPDPREQLTWFPGGWCSAWNDRKQACHRGGGCLCLKPRAHGQGAAMLAAAAPAPQAQAAGQELPPLPEPDGTVEIDCGPAPGGGREIVFEDGYSADQMHAYARAALAQRQPLTKQALQAEFTRQTKDSSLAYRSIAAFDGFLCGARFAERAHGIGGATTGEQR